VYCKHCGEAVFRGESSCTACHEPLRHNPPVHSDEVVEQVRQQLARVQRRMRWVQAVLFLAAVLGAVLVLVKLANSDFDRLKPVPRDQMSAEEKEKDDINRQVFEGRKP
jgi:predicted exporter